MKKEEILAKSRSENKRGDEREQNIEKRANENAYLAIMSVFAILAVAVTIQKFLTGSAFADFNVFLLAILIGFAGKNITKYIFSKKKANLYIAIIGVIGCIACLGSILLLATRGGVI